MSKFYKVKDLLSLSNYAKKYNVNYRKIYRYIGDELIEHYIIDGIPFLPDKQISILVDDLRHNRKNNVKTLTLEVLNVKTLTLPNKGVDNEDVNNVKILTLQQKRILDTSDIKLNGKDLDKKYELINLIKKMKKI